MNTLTEFNFLSIYLFLIVPISQFQVQFAIYNYTHWNDPTRS